MDLLGGLAALGGSVLGFLGEERTNETNINLGREQMAFQREMSSTAYRRAVQDMKDAGLNPMLAYSQGGASTPVGSMPQVQNSVAAGTSSAAQALGTLQAVQTVAQSQAQTEQIKAQTDKIRSETMEQRLNTARLQAEVSRLSQDADLKYAQRVTEGKRPHLLDAQERLALKQVDKTDAEAQLAQIEATVAGDTFSADVARRKALSRLAELEIPKSEAESEFYEGIGELSPYLRHAISLVRGLVDAKGLATDLPRGVFKRR